MRLQHLPCGAKETVHVVVSHKQPLLVSGRTGIRPGGDIYTDRELHPVWICKPDIPGKTGGRYKIE